MQYPQLQASAQSRIVTQEFKGYNANLRCGDGEFSNMKNMTGKYYPVLSPRDKRGVYKKLTAPTGLIAKDAIGYVDGTNFVFNEYSVDLRLNEEEKQIVSMGAYICIFPDKKYINTVDLSDYGDMEASVTTASEVQFLLCRAGGEPYDGYSVSDDPPEEPANMTLWLDTSVTPHSLKQYSAASSMWVPIATTYVRIQADGIGLPFEQWDGVTISGCTAVGTDEFNNTSVIYAKGDDYIVIVGLLDAAVSQDDPITVSRDVPDMDFVVESENRLWGCKYGMVNGQTVNQLYACKLGDFKNWNCFMGISTDSYAVTLGSDGVFTGAITYLGMPTFFKENSITRVYGNMPINFQTQTDMYRGVQRGSYKSLCIVNEIVYYKSRVDVCAYDGSVPTGISYVLGDDYFTQASAGSVGGRYFISMKDKTGKWGLWCFDTAKGVWHKEDETHALQFAALDDDLWFIDSGDNTLKTVNGTLGEKEQDFDWFVETGVIGYDQPDNKYISRYTIRLRLPLGSIVSLYVKYDDGNWEFEGSMRGIGTDSFTLPVVPRRCDHMQFKLSGKGECKIFSIARILEGGSDVFDSN